MTENAHGFRFGLDYPETFARSIAHCIAYPGLRLDLVCRGHSSTLADWLVPGEHWYAKEFEGRRHHYTEADMLEFWHIIELQKLYVQARWLMETTGIALNPALEKVGEPLLIKEHNKKAIERIQQRRAAA